MPLKRKWKTMLAVALVVAAGVFLGSGVGCAILTVTSKARDWIAFLQEIAQNRSDMFDALGG